MLTKIKLIRYEKIILLISVLIILEYFYNNAIKKEVIRKQEKPLS